MLATVKRNVKENTVVIDDEEIDNYMKEMREDRILPNPWRQTIDTEKIFAISIVPIEISIIYW